MKKSPNLFYVLNRSVNFFWIFFQNVVAFSDYLNVTVHALGTKRTKVLFFSGTVKGIPIFANFADFGL